MRISPWFGVVFVVLYLVLVIPEMAQGDVEPPPRMDWAYALVFFGVVYWFPVSVGHSIARIVRGLEQIRPNRQEMQGDVR
jgi:hypothetical protein